MSNYPHTNNKQMAAFLQSLENFCVRMAGIDGLHESAQAISKHYDDAWMLKPNLNVMAAKCQFDEDASKDLIQAIDALFTKKAAHLNDGTPITDLQLVRAIAWLSDNIESHVVILRTLIEMEKW